MFDGNGNQKLIWAMAAVFVGGSIWLSVSWNRSSVKALRTQDVVEYQMPRPKAFRKGFDMSDRNLRVKMIAGEKRETTVAAVPPAAIPPGTTPAKDKKADAKKKTKTAQNKNQRRNQMRVAVVDTDLMMGMSGLEERRSQETRQNYYNNQMIQKKQETAKKEENQLTAAQWREVLNANPSFAKASEFRAAMMSGSISQGAYYKIVEELLISSAEGKTSVAIYLLNQDGSVQAFEMLIKNQTTVTQSQQSAVKALIENFSQTTRFGTLARALSSANADVAREAARLLDVALTTFNNNSSSGNVDPRGSRGSASNSSTSPASFAVFVMPLTQVSKSSSPIASEAAELLQRIQALI